MCAEHDGRAGRGPSVVTRRALRTTLSACVSFFVCLYALDRPVAATYALFAAVSMAALSHIPGTGRQRAAVMVKATPVAWVLLTIGTYLAIRTWSAVAGMLLIGFALAFVAAAGPRAAGAAPGLQLLYILPCFPPYAPDTLVERLAGATFGLLLLVLAEAFVLPEEPGPTYRRLAAGVSGTAARCVAELGRAPYTLSAASAESARAAGESLRPFRTDEADRPAGPGLRDRALSHAGLAARTLLARLVNLPPPPPPPVPMAQEPEILTAVGRAVTETAALLDGRGDTTEAADALRRVREQAAASAAREAPTTAARGRRRAALLEVTDAAVALATAAELAVRGRRARVPEDVDSGRFWYAGKRAPRLWWHRLAGHAGPRSVYFQNAVRISLALAAARTVAGVDSLPHGFWAMLAVLSLTRTTAAQTRATVRVAITGTMLGALATGLLLALIGGHTTVYAIALPFVMLTAFRVGPVRGVGWAQGLFTLVVAFVFAQLAPVTWQLAEVRILDVIIGSLIGVVFGVLAWPRGAQRELHRAVALLLTTEAETVERTTAAVREGGPGHVPDDRPLQHALIMAETAFAQHQSEPRTSENPRTDWHAAMMSGHHTLWGSRRLFVRGGPAVGPANGARLDGRATGVATRMREAAERVGAAPAEAADPLSAPPPGGSAADEPPGVSSPRFFAALAWLDSLNVDVDRMTGSDHPTGAAGPNGSPGAAGAAGDAGGAGGAGPS
ncbi:FUSC family protein [Streptomyces xanthophaeus]|uniref:FUSC family protein n=1 Tax=Streptomyces xanthophaeus TaxID=67385 RepID=UPI0026472D08|nr:FUSC family protein [Streptomyces xanthophaeus]WKD31889.1 FUSC family protein [Streptomyces xanthophaeus]